MRAIFSLLSLTLHLMRVTFSKKVAQLLERLQWHSLHVTTFVFKVISSSVNMFEFAVSQPAFTCSKLTIETLEHGVEYVQS